MGDRAHADLLFPALASPPERPALRLGDRELDYAALRAAAARVAAEIAGNERVAVWAEPRLETAVAGVGALLAGGPAPPGHPQTGGPRPPPPPPPRAPRAGVPAVPVNPKSGHRELAHVARDSAPGAVLAAPGSDLPGPLAELPRRDVALDAPDAGGVELPAEPGPDAPALVVYTSGTTGAPKGALLPRRAIASNLDALAEAWDWTERDVVVHGLPLFHVHGLVLGMLGPLRRGGTAHHLGRFAPDAAAAALRAGGTMLFGVPTMYRRLADACEEDPAPAEALGAARLLVSGSAPLPAAEHERLERLTGQRVVERYGMTETLMICGVRADGDRPAGYRGAPPPRVGGGPLGRDGRAPPGGARAEATRRDGGPGAGP